MPSPPQWRLTDADLVIDCREVDGLFDHRRFPAWPVYEKYSLLGCTPEGPLRAALDGTGPAWLGNLTLGPYPDAAELRDVRVTGSRPAGAGLVDIDLLGHRQGDDGGWAEPDDPECPRRSTAPAAGAAPASGPSTSSRTCS